MKQILGLSYDRQGRPPKAFDRLLIREGGEAARRAIARWVVD